MAQTGAFTKAEMANIAGTLVDISAQVTNLKDPFSRDPLDTTGFGAGGARAAENEVQGAINANPTLDVLLDATTYALAEQMAGNNAGGLLKFSTGRNKQPTSGDAIFVGTYTLVNVTFNIKAGDVQKMKWEFRPTDGGAVVPQWKRI